MNFLILSLIKAAVVAFVLLTTLAYLQWIERKVSRTSSFASVRAAWGRTDCCNLWPTSSS